jgi:hypothetical protein
MPGGGSGQRERRAHRRLKISPESEWIQTMPKYVVMDISPAGIGLTADYPVRTGDMVRVFLWGGPSADAQVLNCRLGRLPKQMLGLEFRLGCRFVAVREGGRLLDEIEHQLASVMG